MAVPAFTPSAEQIAEEKTKLTTDGGDVKTVSKPKTISEQITELSTNLSGMSSQELSHYISLLTQGNAVGEPDALLASKAEFKRDLINVLTSMSNSNRTGNVLKSKNASAIEALAESASQQLIVDRKEGSLRDLVIRELGLPADANLNDLNDLTSRVGYYRKYGEAPGDRLGEIKKANDLLIEKTKADTESGRIDEQIGLATGQREQADVAYKQSLQAFQQQLPTFTPEFNQAMLSKIQGDIAKQGTSAISAREAEFQKRGLTGSSTEAFGLSETGGNITDAIASATLNFLSQSGQQSAQNRQFLVQTLISQAQQKLAASQQTEGLVTGREGASTALSFARQQLQAQIDQFNSTFNENQRQFNVSSEFQQKQAQENLAALMQKLNQRGGSAAAAAGAGALGGAATGASGGFLLGGPVGAAIGGVGGGLLGGLGGYFGSK